MIKWLVKQSNGEQVTIDGAKLAGLLSDKTARTQKPDIDEVTSEMRRMLEANGIIGDFKIAELIHLGISIGYYYRLFLENNDVEVIDEEPTD